MKLLINNNELFKRLSKDQTYAIAKKLSEINILEINEFKDKLHNENNIFYQEELIYNLNFPYLLLKCYEHNILSLNYISTMLILWSCSQEFLTKNKLAQYNPKYIKLFTNDLKVREKIKEFLIESLKSIMPNLFIRESNQIIERVFEAAKKLDLNECGFWLIENFSRCENSISTAIETKGFLFFNQETVCSLIGKIEIIPNLSLIQLILNNAFLEPITINPVFGISSVKDIHFGSKNKIRDMAIPFPNIHLPKHADGFNAYTSLEFVDHDKYHLFRASRVSSIESKEYLIIGERLEQIQKILDKHLKIFENRFQLHICAFKNIYLDDFLKIYKTQDNYIKGLIRKLYKEYKIIDNLKNFKSFLGKLKFDLYDMEMPHSGGRFDSYNRYDNKYDMLKRIIFNIQFLTKNLIKRNFLFKPIYNKILNKIILNALSYAENISLLRKYKQEVLAISNNNQMVLLDNNFNYTESIFNTLLKTEINDYSQDDFIDLLKRSPIEYRLDVVLRKSFVDNREFLFTPMGLEIFEKVLELLTDSEQSKIRKLKLAYNI